MVVTSATIACLFVSARAASPDRWAELAATHDAEACVRCHPPPKAAASVADVVRRMRGEAAPSPPPAPSVAGNIASELAHVAATPAADQARQAMRVAGDLAQNDVRAAATFAAALPPGRAQNAALLVAVHAWFLRDRGAVLQWAEALPDPATREAALHEVARRLASIQK